MAIAIDWVKDLQYLARDDQGHSLVVESRAEGTPSGFTPSQLLLVAAAGCLANHVISILQKKRLRPSEMRITISGQRAEEHPRRYRKIYLRFDLKGRIDKSVLDQVIFLAKDKYCSVFNSLDPSIEIDIESAVSEE